MGYVLHIERGDGITMANWLAAVAKVRGVRVDLAAPRVAGRRGPDADLLPVRIDTADVEVGGRWVPVFRWAEGTVSFQPPADAPFAEPVRRTAGALAHELGAVIIGDEGEEYDW